MSYSSRISARKSDKDSTSDIMKRKELMKSRCYGLFAVVVHSGATINSGITIATLDQPIPRISWISKTPRTSPWLKLNDSRISVVDGGFNKMRSEIRESVSATAYVLLYQRLNKGPEMLRQQSTFQSEPKNPSSISKCSDKHFEADAQGDPFVESRSKHRTDGVEDDDDDERMLAAALTLSAARVSPIAPDSRENEAKKSSDEEDDDDALAAALALSSTGNSDEHSNVGQNEHAGSSGLNTPMAISSASKGNVAQLQNELDSLEQREREDALHVEKFRSKMHAYTKSNASYLMSTLAERTSKQWLGILRDLALIQTKSLQSAEKAIMNYGLFLRRSLLVGWCNCEPWDSVGLTILLTHKICAKYRVLFLPSSGVFYFVRTKRGHLDMRPLSGCLAGWLKHFVMQLMRGSN